MHRPALIIHGHFYQPPRENPWTGEVDREPSAAPFHDWNERIHRECYRPNAFARVVDERGAVADIVNNYEHASFNFGPTLFSWLAGHHPATLQRVLDADRKSLRDRGHGNAIAQGYNHAILPLCNDRDLRTQVRWGLAEFRHRFGRDAEALWMPETACDDRTLGVLIDEGMRYALLAPGQAARIQTDSGWQDVMDGSIDPRRPYRYLHSDGSGRSLALFFYDGAVSRAVAFEGALASSQALVERFVRASGGEGTLVHAVTDGESYGHHFKFGDRCLAYALTREAKRRGFWITNYGELLDHHPPTIDVEVKLGEDGRGTSWSCAHGVGRWLRDCGCNTGGKPSWNQRWRTPLREALDDLRDQAARIFEERMGDLAADPWAVRDAYIDLVVRPASDRGAFFERVVGRRLSTGEQHRALALLEMQRSSMLMFTSCGWFFSELSGIETVQVMRYAGRLLDQLAELDAGSGEAAFLERLAEARSNLGEKGSGADIYRTDVRPTRVRAEGLAAQVAIQSLPGDLDVSAGPAGDLAGHRYRMDNVQKRRRGRLTMLTARVDLEDVRTGKQHHFGCCALHFGGVEMHCVLRPIVDPDELIRAAAKIAQAFDAGSLLGLLRVAEEQLGPEDYGLGHILSGGREAVSQELFAETGLRFGALYEAMYQDARQAIGQFDEAGLPLPEELRMAAGLALAYRFEQEIAKAPAGRFEPSAYQVALSIAREAARYGCTLRRELANEHFEALLTKIMYRVCSGDRDEAHTGTSPTDAALALLELTEQLGLSLSFERAQELLHRGIASGLEPSEPILRLGEALGLSPSLVTHSGINEQDRTAEGDAAAPRPT